MISLPAWYLNDIWKFKTLSWVHISDRPKKKCLSLFTTTLFLVLCLIWSLVSVLWKESITKGIENLSSIIKEKWETGKAIVLFFKKSFKKMYNPNWRKVNFVNRIYLRLLPSSWKRFCTFCHWVEFWPGWGSSGTKALKTHKQMHTLVFW